MGASIKRIGILVALGLLTSGCSGARDNSQSLGYNKLDLEYINGKSGSYIHNLNHKAKVTYRGNEKVTGDGLVSFRYTDYDGKTTTELFPLAGKWNSKALNSNIIKINNSEFKLNFDTDAKSDLVQLSYFIQNGVFNLVYWGSSEVASYNIYKNGILLVNTTEPYFNDFALNTQDSLVYQGSEIIAKQNDGLNIADSFYIRPVLADGTEGSKSNILSLKDIAGDIPVEVDDDILKVGVKLDNPKDLPREVKVKLLNGGTNYYNIDYRLDEATRFTDKIYYRYYINNTNLKGFAEVNLLNSFSIPSTVENGVITSQELSPFKLTVLDQKDALDLTLVDLNSYGLTADKREDNKVKVYEDIYSKIKGRETEIDLDSYILNKQDYIDIAEQLELDFYSILDSIVLDRRINKILLVYNDNKIEIFNSIDGAYDYILKNNITNDKEISSIINLGLADTKSVKGTKLGQVKYFNIIKIGDNYYNIDFSSKNKEMFMCSDKQAYEMGYTKNKSFLDYKCLDDSKEYYLENKLVANNIDEYKDMLKREVLNGSYNINIKYIGDGLTSSQIIDAISNVFDELNKRDLLSRVKFADSNKIYTIRIGE